jgi:hypothetical protein
MRSIFLPLARGSFMGWNQFLHFLVYLALVCQTVTCTIVMRLLTGFFQYEAVY